jgi:hypothetical protein
MPGRGSDPVLRVLDRSGLPEQRLASMRSMRRGNTSLDRARRVESIAGTQLPVRFGPLFGVPHHESRDMRERLLLSRRPRLVLRRRAELRRERERLRQRGCGGCCGYRGYGCGRHR